MASHMTAEEVRQDYIAKMGEELGGQFNRLTNECAWLHLKWGEWEMREEGVQFLAGTDVGVVFMYPGFSLHDELEKLVRDVGFTPMDALAVATDGVPRFYGETAVVGAVEPHHAADLVLLDADPLADIKNTRRIAAVAVRGRWFDRSALDRMLRNVQESAMGSCAQAGNKYRRGSQGAADQSQKTA